MKKAKMKKTTKQEPLGEIDAAEVIARYRAERRAGTLSAATILDLAEALRERLPFDCSEVVGDFQEEHQDRAAEEVSDLCQAIAAISADRDALGVTS